ncbi:tetrahydrofolate synthase [Halolactibacillus alkaliphilus]|uniref:tetrahydrofolate synthase n=1 Tax=Halolactibacillus alkaliphilus TaxID=442899 RepID=A0A511WXZ4_9BACI|nr:folylpolyglutamate synthase/dihydrofolate synthase family protein [Halolactibacillus alkaliphilus]GEN55984.1 tetrahydrofolate synthase [Halolactibacillus alkaliphilus]GGN68258.1 tetrahydrofolate synthase [Halolactibacillus alkaliphilus]SFO69372.1 dihydrofolate synthase / folylpolyglutamate synthase [Halolactibacillus alkaliphilus]
MFTTCKAVNHYLDQREKVGIKPGLSRVKKLLASVGFYDQPFKGIHVAGTNGKGSTVTYLASCYEACGKRVGTFTSPSLTDRRGMIKLNQQPMDAILYVDYFNQFFPVIDQFEKDQDPASPFEIMVVIALKYFQDHSDVAVIEAGLGGKSDATNVFTPIASVITSIGYDHMQFLGTTLEDIAKQKAGIIKEEVPVIIGDVTEEAKLVIRKEANSKRAPFYFFGDSFTIKKDNDEWLYQSMNLKLAFTLRMKGKHQAYNAAVAIKTLFVLNQNRDNVSLGQIKKGIKEAIIKGRFEQISQRPNIVIDGAHNTEAMEMFVETVREMAEDDEKKVVLFAAFKDKPIKKMLELIATITDHVVLTTFDHPRAATIEELKQFTPENVTVTQTNDWLNYLHQLKADDHQVTYVVGSLDFIGKVRQNIV